MSKTKSKSRLKQAEDEINEKTELWFLNRLIDHNKMQLSNTRIELKRLIKEQQLLLNIKKKWKS